MTHGHEGHHHHDDNDTKEMSFSEKMEKLLAHWIHHNEDHLANYKQWAQAAGKEGKKELAGKLDEAADLTGQITKVFQAAEKLIS